MTYSNAQMFNRSLIRLVVVLLAGMLTGCAADIPTSPDTFNVEPALASHLRAPQVVALNNAYKGEAKMPLQVGSQTWTLDQKQLTDTAIVMLRRPLEKQGVTASAQAEKAITLRAHAESGAIHKRALSFVAHYQATLILEARFADGTVTTTRSQGSSPMGPQRAFEGAVLSALNQLLVDPKFVAYMNK